MRKIISKAKSLKGLIAFLLLIFSFLPNPFSLLFYPLSIIPYPSSFLEHAKGVQLHFVLSLIPNTLSLIPDIVPSAYAEPPVKFTYQGNIRQSGILVTGTRKMRFSIYDSSSGPTALWTSPEMDVTVSTGVFRVVLEPNITSEQWNNELWLELEIEGTKLSPREQITSSIYTINTLLHSGKRYTTSASTPSVSNTGDLWMDTSSRLLKYYDGSNWVPTSGSGLPGPHASTHGPGGSDEITALGTHTVSGYINVSSSVIASWFIGDGSQLTNLNGANLQNLSVPKEKLSGSGCLNNQLLAWKGSGWQCVSPAAGSEQDPWSIHLQDTLQEGSTFYVSSGTVNYFTVNNSFLSLAPATFVSSISVLSSYGIFSPKVEFLPNIFISSAGTNYYSGIYISTHQYINGNIYATKFIGDGSQLTNVTVTNIPAEISVSTINAISTTPYGGIHITTNIFVSGNIGVGTTSPQAKLDVAGMVRSTFAFSPGDGTNFQSSRYMYDDSLNYRTAFSSNVYIVGYSSATKYYGDGSELVNLNGANLQNLSVPKEKLSGSGCLNNQLLAWNGSGWQCVNPSASSEVDPWSIHLQDTLQEGSTFYVSSGTVNYFTVNNSFLSLAPATFVSSISVLSNYGIYSPKIEFSPNISISSATANYYGGIYISTHQYINGNIYATKFIGDGSQLTGISGDNLGNHIATTTLNMNNYGIINVSSITAYGYITTYSTMTVMGNAFSVGGSTFTVKEGKVGIGTDNPNSALDVTGSENSGEYVMVLKSGAKVAAWLRNK